MDEFHAKIFQLICKKHPDWPLERCQWLMSRWIYWSDLGRRKRLFDTHKGANNG